MLTTESEAAILQRVIQPNSGDMPSEAAHAFLALRFTDADLRRMNQLSTRASDGVLSKAEEDELDGYISVSHFIAFVQSKARLSLKNAAMPGSA